MDGFIVFLPPAVSVLAYSIVSAYSMVLASRGLHARMLHNILRSPMCFFDTTPIGRILNRFSRDIETIDNILPNLFRSWMNTFFSVISTVVVISYSTPIFLSVVLPLGLLYYFVQVRMHVVISSSSRRWFACWEACFSLTASFYFSVSTSQLHGSWSA